MEIKTFFCFVAAVFSAILVMVTNWEAAVYSLVFWTAVFIWRITK